MQGDPKVIDYLNKGLRHELTAINQYWLHYRLLDNWGLLDMAKVCIDAATAHDKKIVFLNNTAPGDVNRTVRDTLEEWFRRHTIKEILQDIVDDDKRGRCGPDPGRPGSAQRLPKLLGERGRHAAYGLD